MPIWNLLSSTALALKITFKLNLGFNKYK